MFKVFKYLLLVKLYQKAKKSFVMLFVYIVSLVLLSFMMDDIISISSDSLGYILVLIKWILNLLLLVLIASSILKIYTLASSPFEQKEKKVTVDTKKDRILAKEKLFTQSDLIMQKYTKD